jgi:hypothetical protein
MNKNKMRNRLLIAILVSILGFQYVNAQENLASKVFPEHKYYPLKGKVSYKLYPQVKGNPYLMKDWIVGDIYLTNGKILKSVQLKFDIYSHDLLVYHEYHRRVILLESESVDHFSFENDGRKYIFSNQKTIRKLKLGRKQFFIELLLEDRISLYKLHFNEIVPLRTPKMPYLDEFVRGQAYYIVQKGQWIDIKLRRSALFKQFPEFKSQLKQYTRKNKLRLRKEKDFVDMLDYLNELIASS